MPLSLPEPWWGFPLLGVCAGLLSGTLGVGSGLLVVPALVLLFGYGQKSAQGTCLVMMAPMVLVAAFRYWRNPEVELSGAALGLLVAGGVVAAYLGAELAARLPAPVLKRIFAAFLVAAAAKMVFDSFGAGERAPGRGPTQVSASATAAIGGRDGSSSQ